MLLLMCRSNYFLPFWELSFHPHGWYPLMHTFISASSTVSTFPLLDIFVGVSQGSQTQLLQNGTSKPPPTPAPWPAHLPPLPLAIPINAESLWNLAFPSPPSPHPGPAPTPFPHPLCSLEVVPTRANVSTGHSAKGPPYFWGLMNMF